MTLVVRPAAETDLADAFNWYEERSAGLGHEFLAAVDAAMANIRENPTRFPIVHNVIRRALLRRFPYGLYYLDEPDRIVVLAVFHASRDPGAWKSRGPS